MGLELLLQGAATAASVGMGCGTCCGSGISVFLSGYLMTHAKSFRQSLGAFLSFYLGKIMAVMLVCGAASVLGAEVQSMAGLPVKALVDVLMICMGIWLLVQWVRERRGTHHCLSCGHCDKKRPQQNGRLSWPVLWSMGIGYGISPCAPLLMMAGYASTLPMGYALTVGGLFALFSAVSPMLFLLILSGALAGKMQKEIPQYLTWFRLACYILLIIFFAIELLDVV